MTRKEQDERIEELLNSLTPKDIIERLERGGGCEADKGQCDAEEAKPGSAALIPPVQAEAILYEAVLAWRLEAARLSEKVHFYAMGGGADAVKGERKQAAIYRQFADDLDRRIAESRKAKAVEVLHPKPPEDHPVPKMVGKLNEELSGRRNGKS